jgi:hypothetical protein
MIFAELYGPSYRDWYGMVQKVRTVGGRYFEELRYTLYICLKQKKKNYQKDENWIL